MSKFTEKWKKRSLLAALFYILRGRAKYITIGIMIIALSLPFIASGENIARMLDFPVVSSILKSLGLGSVLDRYTQEYNRKLISSALNKAAEEGNKYSLWEILFGKNYSSRAGDIKGTVGLVTNNEDIKQKNLSAGDIKGLVSDEEKRNGNGADAVDFGDLIASGANAKGEASDNLGAFSGYGPYLNSEALSSKTSIVYKKEGIYNLAMASTKDLPQPQSSRGVVKKNNKMGRISGFNWKSAGYTKTKSPGMDVRINSKRRAMFQVSETFATTSSGYASKSPPEYQAALVGSTYDGNHMNADIITTGEPTSVPDASFTPNVLKSAYGWQQANSHCAEVSQTENRNIADYSKILGDKAPKLADRPKCCDHGKVRSYNSNIDDLMDACAKYNASITSLNSACQTNGEKLDCQKNYGKYRMHTCSKWKCFFSFILGLILLIAGIICLATGVGAVVGTALIAGGAAFIGAQFGLFGNIGNFLNEIADWAAYIFVVPIAASAIALSYAINSDSVKKWGKEELDRDGDDGAWGGTGVEKKE